MQTSIRPFGAFARQLPSFVTTAIGAVMLARLAVAVAVLAGKAIGWLADSARLGRLAFDPVDIENPRKLAVNVGLIAFALTLLIAPGASPASVLGPSPSTHG